MLGREHAIGHPALTHTGTGLANTLHFELVYSYLFASGDRGVAFSLMLVSLGPDDVADPMRLKDIGERIQDTTRMSDLVAYFGDGRFGILLLGTNLQGARLAADRMEQALEDLQPGTLSLGIASYDASMKESSELLAAADGALRVAEEAGGGIELA